MKNIYFYNLKLFIFLNCKCTEYGNPISVGKRISRHKDMGFFIVPQA